MYADLWYYDTTTHVWNCTWRASAAVPLYNDLFVMLPTAHYYNDILYLFGGLNSGRMIMINQFFIEY